SARWRRRAIFVLGGIAVGAAAVTLTLLANQAQSAFGVLVAHFPYAAFAVTPLGFALSVYLTGRFFPNSQGSGIPQAIAARQLADQGARGRLVSIRIAIGKIVLTLLGLLCGASAGREGPTVQVGASLMFAVGRLSHLARSGRQLHLFRHQRGDAGERRRLARHSTVRRGGRFLRRNLQPHP